MPFTISQKNAEPKVLYIDEQYRPDASIEELAKQQTVYGNPTVTAGLAPGLPD